MTLHVSTGVTVILITEAMSSEWRKRARNLQQNFAVYLSNRIWDRFTKYQGSQLRKKIAYAICGPPKREDGSYTKEQEELVSELVGKCKEHCNERDDVIIAFLFVCAYKDSSTEVTVPLIRVKKNSGRDPKSSYFIDHVGRVYKNWTEFLEDNTLDGFWICTPKDAKYSFSDEDVELEFHDQSERGKIVAAIDTASTITSIVTTGFMTAGVIMSFFPPTAPLGVATITASSIVGAPAAAYGTGRSVGKLVDRGTHSQSINPFSSSDARSCWLTTTASLLTVGTISSGYMVASKAAAGGLIGGGTRALCTALNVSSLSVSGFGIVNAFYEVAKKDKVTTLDILQLSISVLFFTHSSMNFKTAKGIIKSAQKSAISGARGGFSPEGQKDFDDVLGAVRGAYGRGKTMHANAEFIQNLGEFDNPVDFFDHFKMKRCKLTSKEERHRGNCYTNNDLRRHFDSESESD